MERAYTSYSLTPQQQEAIERFKKLKVGALFMDMGTGKTRAAVEIVNYNNPDFLLYITPYNTKDNIIKELEKWGVCCPYEVVGYETIAMSDRTYIDIYNQLDRYKKAFIVADESIFIKSKKAKRHNRAVELRKKCEYALILNGTPIVRSEWDLYNQMRFLSEKIIPYNSYDFIQKFFVEHMERRGGRTHHYYTFYEPNRPALTKYMAPYVYEAELEFGKSETEKVYWVACDSTKYEEAKKEALQKAWEGDYDAFVNLFTACQHQAAIAPEKNRRVAEYIDGQQVIVFCNFTEEVEQIRQHCDCYVITGSTRAKERKKIFEAFEKSEKPLVMTMGIGSYSLNLQFCDEIVYSSITFNYGLLEQSQYRIKRVGQERDIKYTYILGDFGINKMMFENLDRKESLSTIIKRLIEEQDIDDFIEPNDIQNAQKTP